MRKLLFVSCLAFLTFFNATAQDVNAITDSIKAQQLRDWQRAKTYTKAYLDAMPENGIGFKPTPEIRSFAEQMLHLASANYFFLSAIIGKENPIKEESLEKNESLKSNKAALQKTVMDSYDYVINTLNGMDARSLTSVVNAEHMPPGLTRLTMLNKAFEHQTHHRGQCTIYLRLKGITPPGEMLF